MVADHQNSPTAALESLAWIQSSWKSASMKTESFEPAPSDAPGPGPGRWVPEGSGGQTPPGRLERQQVQGRGSASLELLEEVRRLEVLGHVVVQAGDNLVDGLLPRLLLVLAGHDGAEKLA